MIVLILERVPAGLRGELSRWMIEPRTGVFVGRLSAAVRDMLWLKAVRGAKDGGAAMLFTSSTEQGFSIRTYGDTTRQLMDFEGIALVHVPEIKRPKTGKIESAEAV